MSATAILTAITAVTDATAIIAALMPLIERQTSGGEEVTEEDVRQALAGKDAALKRLDELIAQQD